MHRSRQAPYPISFTVWSSVAGRRKWRRKKRGTRRDGVASGCYYEWRVDDVRSVGDVVGYMRRGNEAHYGVSVFYTTKSNEELAMSKNIIS